MPSSCFRFGPVKCSTHRIEDLLQEIHLLLDDRAEQPRTINCLNAHIFNLAWSDHGLRENLNRSRIVTADGIAIVWLARLFGGQLAERCNMTEAFRAFMNDRSFPRTRAILIGGSEQIAKRASEAITNANSRINIVESLSGYLPLETYQVFCSQYGPVDFVLLGVGTPKSEQLSQMVAEARPEAIIWHIGGGTILILAGCVSEAPASMRRLGLQWLHRLWQEPKRMWRRYVIGNVLFLLRCLVSVLKT